MVDQDYQKKMEELYDIEAENLKFHIVRATMTLIPTTVEWHKNHIKQAEKQMQFLDIRLKECGEE